MALNPAVKSNWIELQKKRSVPVNAIGLEIGPKDHATLKVWREEGIDQYMLREGLEEDAGVQSPGDAGLPEEIQEEDENRPFVLMATFVARLVDELGDKGFGRDNLLEVVEHRLSSLAVKYSCLEEVTVVNGQIDFSPLTSAGGDVAEVTNAWVELIGEIYQSGVDNLGQGTADEKYSYVHDTLYQQDPSLFDRLALNDVLPSEKDKSAQPEEAQGDNVSPLDEIPTGPGAATVWAMQMQRDMDHADD